ncbi:MAG: hypothetical protein ACLQMT_06785 [Candidatus Acidiferrales bacterium]
MKQAVVIASLLLASGVARANDSAAIVAYHSHHHNPIAHIFHYVATHKELLSMDAMTATAISLDVIATNRCERIGHDLSSEDGLPNQCVETDSILGQHPSGAKTWTLGLIYIGGFVAANHVGHWAAWDEEGHSTFHAFWAPNVFITGLAIGDFVCDWHTGNVLAAQRSGIVRH